jgi:hypothetical protein
MAKLSTKERKRVSKSDLALPGKRSRTGGKGGYPIEDETHGRNALARVSQFGTPKEKAEVRRKVHEKYPDIGGGKRKTGDREGRGASRRAR